MKLLMTDSTSKHVLVGASVPAGLRGCKLLRDLKLGNFMLTALPADKKEALEIAEYCKRYRVYFMFSEVLFRGTLEPGFNVSQKTSWEQFYTKKDLAEVCRAGGEYYLGRMTVGEIGGLLYWLRPYCIREPAWRALPKVQTADEAKQAYINELRKFLRFERERLGGGPLWDIDASCTFKYHLEAGIDFPMLEAMCGDYTFMTAAIRGAAKAYSKSWGTHIAIGNYGGFELDAMWLKRWKMSLYMSFLSGSALIYPESGYFAFRRGEKGYPFRSHEMLEARRVLREFYQFAQIHSRPIKGPKVTLGFIYGNLDGYPGLWNKYVWGQSGRKWLSAAAEWGWENLDDLYRKTNWNDENALGEMDFSGQPPYGQYDIVPIEAPISFLKNYKCLIFLGWNTMTPEIYGKLKSYVEEGGHLLMSVPHLSMETDRSKPLRLYNDGDWRDLFGVVVMGKGKSGVGGVKAVASPTVRSYKMPVQGFNADPRFIGNLALARIKIHGAKIISVWSDYHRDDETEALKNPVLTEFSLGKGKAFLLNSWVYPGDRNWTPYLRSLLRIISEGEQGGIRITGSDRLWYAVYEGHASGSRIVYLLNTEYDTPHLVDLWIDGRVCPRLTIEPTEMKVVYELEDIVLVPEDRGVEIERWESKMDCHTISSFLRRDTTFHIFNLSHPVSTVDINGSQIRVSSGEERSLRIRKRADPDRAEFFSSDFLNEPDLGQLPPSKLVTPY